MWVYTHLNPHVVFLVLCMQFNKNFNKSFNSVKETDGNADYWAKQNFYLKNLAYATKYPLLFLSFEIPRNGQKYNILPFKL